MGAGAAILSSAGASAVIDTYPFNPALANPNIRSATAGSATIGNAIANSVGHAKHPADAYAARRALPLDTVPVVAASAVVSRAEHAQAASLQFASARAAGEQRRPA
jgi:hypothetical protein